MAKDNMPQPPEDAGPDRDAGDTDEWLGDHPELAPDESRVSTGIIRDMVREPIRRRANVGDIGDSAAEAEPPPGRGLPESQGGFDRNHDFMGNEGSLSADADFSRGSGWLGGKPAEDAEGAGSGQGSGPKTPRELANPQGFEPSAGQQRNRDAIAREESNIPVTQDGLPPELKTREGLAGDNRTQGRDLGSRVQATATQAFGRDVGSSGLPGGMDQGEEDFEETGRRRAAMRQHADWNAALAKLGGGSPGSGENLELIEKFSMVNMPATREEVLQKLPSGSGFRIRDISIDLREAVSESRMTAFGTVSDLIECVKEAIRRAEGLQAHPG